MRIENSLAPPEYNKNLPYIGKNVTRTPLECVFVIVGPYLG